MTPQKPADRSSAAASTGAGARKPWRKKTPVEVVVAQTDILRQQIKTREQELTDLRQQLQKFEQARKIFEAS